MAGKRGSGLTKIKYHVSAELAEIVGSGPISRPEVVKNLWAYIKKHPGIQSGRKITPDSKLSKVLGAKSIDMLKMAGKLSSHLTKV